METQVVFPVSSSVSIAHRCIASEKIVGEQQLSTRGSTNILYIEKNPRVHINLIMWFSFFLLLDILFICLAVNIQKKCIFLLLLLVSTWLGMTFLECAHPVVILCFVVFFSFTSCFLGVVLLLLFFTVPLLLVFPAACVLFSHFHIVMFSLFQHCTYNCACKHINVHRYISYGLQIFKC